jgi:putative methionine-R-sulfoxide reductase with GAF domain
MGDDLDKNEVLRRITEILDSSADRAEKARSVAEAVRLAGRYRWVGIYDVGEREIAAIAWTGSGAPAHPRFPVTQGLSGHAVSTRRAVISNDVANDPRYLTAFGSTQSEIIIPVISHESQQVVGTLDVESEFKGAFTETDRERLEEYARVLARLWA